MRIEIVFSFPHGHQAQKIRVSFSTVEVNKTCSSDIPPRKSVAARTFAGAVLMEDISQDESKCRSKTDRILSLSSVPNWAKTTPKRSSHSQERRPWKAEAMFLHAIWGWELLIMLSTTSRLTEKMKNFPIYIMGLTGHGTDYHIWQGTGCLTNFRWIHGRSYTF